MRLSFFILLGAFLLSFAMQAQNCPPPTLVQEIFVFPTEAQFQLSLTEAINGSAEIVPQGEPFSNAVSAVIFANKVRFIGLNPNTTYDWRARATCNIGGQSDWSVVYTFTTPPPCPPIPVIPLDSVIQLTFPASSNPNIGYSLCEVPTQGKGYMFRYLVTVSGDYWLTIPSASGGPVRTGIKVDSSDFCRGNLNCYSGLSEQGTNIFFSALAGQQIVLGFTGPASAATRSFRLRYAPCGEPAQFFIDTIKPNQVRIYAFAPAMDIEIKAEQDTFTGVPEYVHLVGPVTLGNLQPGTSYHWRGRNNCGTAVSSWVNGPGFTTPYFCDNIPWLKCDSIYAGFPAGLGRQRISRYRPDVSYNFVLTSTNGGTGNNALTVALRDSALGDCFSPAWPLDAWPVFACCGSVPDTISLGYVEAGKTYYVYVNKGNEQPSDATLRWNCPSACPAPGQLFSSLANPTSVTLQWHNNELSPNWEIELTPATVPFSGSSQYSGTGSTYLVPGLQLATEYHWRIRNVCAGPGAGEWSETASFYMPQDCADAIEISLENTSSAYSLPGFSLLATCTDFNQGAERFYRFTPTENGDYLLNSFAPNVSYAIKPLGGNCAEAAGWTCIGSDFSSDQNDTWSLGPLVLGQTYLIAVDYPAYPGLPGALSNFVLTHPVTCPAPDGLSVSNIQAHAVQLGWNGQTNHNNWEIEVQLNDGSPFTGTPNYFSNQTDLAINGLLANTRYKFQIRAQCGFYGQSLWSGAGGFTTLLDCNEYPPLACGQLQTLHFEAGIGSLGSLPTCPDNLIGKEEIVQFTTDASTRYIFLPGQHAYIGFYLKNTADGDCNELYGWTCVGNSDSTVIMLNNLTPGATYYLLCRRHETFGADSLRLGLYCSFPCVAPVDPQTTIISGGAQALVKWDGGNGSWNYEVALQYPDGSEQTKSGLHWTLDGQNLLDWFSVQSNDIYAWRVRAVCSTGDTTVWTPYSYFRLPLCTGAKMLGCYDTVVTAAELPTRYAYYDFCSGNTLVGQQRLFYLVTQPGGTFKLHLNLGIGVAAQYAISDNVGVICGNGTGVPAALWPAILY